MCADQWTNVSSPHQEICISGYFKLPLNKSHFQKMEPISKIQLVPHLKLQSAKVTMAPSHWNVLFPYMSFSQTWRKHKMGRFSSIFAFSKNVVYQGKDDFKNSTRAYKYHCHNYTIFNYRIHKHSRTFNIQAQFSWILKALTFNIFKMPHQNFKILYLTQSTR